MLTLPPHLLRTKSPADQIVRSEEGYVFNVSTAVGKRGFVEDVLPGLAWTGLWLDSLAPSFSVIQSLWIYYFEPKRGHRVPFSTEYR